MFEIPLHDDCDEVWVVKRIHYFKIVFVFNWLFDSQVKYSDLVFVDNVDFFSEQVSKFHAHIDGWISTGDDLPMTAASQETRAWRKP